MSDKKNPDHTITLGAFSSEPEPLILGDDERNFGNSKESDKEMETSVAPGDLIRWVALSDITSFTITYAKGNNIFQSGPSPQSDGSWEGVVGDLPEGSIEEYNISYKVKGSSTTYTQDPKLAIRPRT